MVTIESITGVFRNYPCFTDNSKKMALVGVAVTCILHLALCIHAITEVFYQENWIIIKLIICSHLLIPTFIVVVAASNGIRYAESFLTLKASLDRVYKYCIKSIAYKESMKNFFVIFLLAASISGLYILLVILYSFHFYELFVGRGVVAACLDLMSTLMSFSRQWCFSTEFYIFNVYIRIISVFLTQFKKSLSNIAKNVEGLDGEIDEMTCQRFKEELKRFSSAYNSLAVCCDKLKQCYGPQVNLLLMLLTVQPKDYLFYFSSFI